MVNAIDGNSFTELKCNVLHLTYSCSNAVPEILPRSYHEALWYLTGRRYFNRFRESVSHDMGNGSAPEINGAKKTISDWI